MTTPVDPGTGEDELRAQMLAQLALLGPEYKANLDYMVAQILDPNGLKTFSFPRANVMDDNTFALFLTWYLQDNGVTFPPYLPLIDLSGDPVVITIIVI